MAMIVVCLMSKDVKWIQNLTLPENAASAFRKGGSTIIPQKEMSAKKQERLRVSIKKSEDSVSYIDRKRNICDEVLAGKRSYVRNLIRADG